MKTSRLFSANNKFQTPLQWRNLNDYLKTSGSALWCWLLGAPSHGQHFLWSLPHALKNRSLMNRLKTFVLAALAVLVIPVSTRALIQSAIINNRIYIGLFLSIIVAPLSACIHVLPGMGTEIHIEGWLYENYRDLFLVLGPYFFCLFILISVFMLVPPTTERVKFSKKHVSFQITRMISLPMGLVIGKIIWLSLCSTNEDFDVLFHPVFFLGGLVSYPLIRLLDYLVWRQEHVMNALIDSLDGLYNKVDIDAETKLKMAAPLWRDLRKFNSKY